MHSDNVLRMQKFKILDYKEKVWVKKYTQKLTWIQQFIKIYYFKVWYLHFYEIRIFLHGVLDC